MRRQTSIEPRDRKWVHPYNGNPGDPLQPGSCDFLSQNSQIPCSMRTLSPYWSQALEICVPLTPSTMAQVPVYKQCYSLGSS